MQRFLLKMALIIFSLGMLQTAGAQSKEFENVVEVTLNKTVTIKNNNAIVGYALFYKVDKMKKMALYRVEILDENLKSIGSNEFEGSKDLQLVEALYESDRIMLAFTDPKKVDDYEKFVKVFDLKGKEKGLVPYDPEKVKKGMFGAAIAEQMDQLYGGFMNVEGKGFVCLYQSKAKVGGADIQMIDVNGKLKWERNYAAEKGDRMDMYLTATTPNAIILFCIERESIMKADTKNFLVGLDPATGKELYKKTMEIKSLAWEPILFKIDDNGVLKMISSLSHEEDKYYKAKPIGFNIADLNDKTGEITAVKPYLFEKDLSAVLDMQSESKSEDGYIKMHDITLMSDGSTVLVGEFFRKTVSALGMAGKILSKGSVSAAQASIGDMFLLHIDKNGKAFALDKVEKKVSRTHLPSDGLSIGLTIRWLDYIGSFGYMYTDELADPTKRTVLVRGTLEGEKYGTAAVTFDGKKGYKIKKFTVETEKKESLYITRAKPGHVLVMKYNSKEKKVALNLERVN